MNQEFMKHQEEIEGSLSEEEQLYKENILDHYKHPHNKREIKNSVSNKEINPNCGDEITVFLEVKDGKVNDSSFIGQGCAISQAGISLLTDEIKGKSVLEVKRIKSEDVYKLLGIPISVTRIKCALLSLKSVQGAIKKHEQA
jgi:nitrogen fixation NifU-like protein